MTMNRTLCTCLIVLAAAVLAGAQPRTAAELFRSGMEALAAEHYDEAEQDFRAAVKMDPLYDAAFYGLGQVYMATKRYERAVQAYLDSREAFKAATAAEAMQGAESDRRLKDQILALKDYVRNLERSVRSGNAASARAAIDRNNEQIRQLESRLGRKVGAPTPPIPAGLSMALGSAYFRVNRVADAELEYKAAIQVHPRFGEAHSNLAVVYLVTGRIEEADKEIEAAKKAGFHVNPQLEQDIRARRKAIKLDGGGLFG